MIKRIVLFTAALTAAAYSLFRYQKQRTTTASRNATKTHPLPAYPDVLLEQQEISAQDTSKNTEDTPVSTEELDNSTHELDEKSVNNTP